MIFQNGFIIKFMRVETIEKNQVEYFFNKYKHNIDQIFYLERKLINESYCYEKWEKLLTQNSELTRQFFSENEEMLEEYLRPAIISPEKMNPEILETYLRHILFFLFENNIDYHVTEDLPKSILRREEDYSELIQFEANMCLAISHTVSVNSTYEETYKYFKRCFEIYPNFESAPDDNTRVHVSFCFCYVLLMFILYKSTDYKEFIKCYEHFERNIQTGNISVYTKMWGEKADYSFHIDLILRHFRLYGVMMGGLSEFSLNAEASDYQEQLIAANVLKTWMYEEYKIEEEEGNINPMIFTFVNRDRYKNQAISFKEYHNLLLAKFNEVKKLPFIYPEAGFPQDDDPVDPQFAKVIDKMKIFSRSHTANFVLLPELFKLTKDSDLKNMIVSMIVRFYESSKYNAKGFDSDLMLVNNIKQIASNFENATEFASFLQTIFIHRQISTANHLSMLSNIATLCLSKMIDKRPELFVFPEKAETPEQVISQKTNLLIYIKNGALLHDIGKLYCSKLINMHFRKINSCEFGLIQKHSENGLDIIENIDYLKDYADIIVGHHKSWNGATGYPSSFELSYSKYKNFINLISICDAIDMATDGKGRNYTEPRDFDEIIEELKADNGKKYSPELVSLIAGDSQLIDELKYITGKGRNFVSYKTYQQFILPNTKFSEEDEKSVQPYSKKIRSEVEKFYKTCFPQNEHLVSKHMQEVLDPETSRAYVLCDNRKKVFGLICGWLCTSLEDGKEFFQMNEIIILPEERRKGLGSYLFNSVLPMLKEEGISKIRINAPTEFWNSSFFWIEGFSPCKQTSMEKNIF